MAPAYQASPGYLGMAPSVNFFECVHNLFSQLVYLRDLHTLAKAIDDGHKSVPPTLAPLMALQFNIDLLLAEGKVISADPGSEASGGSVAADR